MPVKLKDVKGLELEKHISEHSIGLNREKLAKIIWSKQEGVKDYQKFMDINECELLASAILSEEAEIIEFCPDNTLT